MKLNNFAIEQYTLDNGLTVILHKRRDIPLAATNIWYRVGSANEVTGKTGLAHLFEHMMFQGSVNVPKGMHFHYVQQAGGTLNASTSFDRTNYFQKVPAHFLERMLWLESDRMGNYLPALDEEKLKNQIDVVSNERLERYDNQPYGLAFEKLLRLMYSEDHPYASPVIGFLDDIKAYTLDDVKDFFSRHYTPSNASLVIAGDFEEQNVKEMVERYFGEIHGAGNAVKLSTLNEAQRKFSGYEEFQDNVELDRFYLAWHTVPSYQEDDMNLEMLSDVLTGSKNGFLKKALTIEQQIAQSVSSYQFSGKYGGFFVVQVTMKPGKPIDEAKKIVLDIIEKLKSEQVPDRELQRSKNIITSGFIYRLQNLSTISDLMNQYAFYLGTPDGFQVELDRYNNIFNDDIMRMAKAYFGGTYGELRVLRRNDGK
jgi:zinc protease